VIGDSNMEMGVRALFRLDNTNSDALVDLQRRLDQVPVRTNERVAAVLVKLPPSAASSVHSNDALAILQGSKLYIMPCAATLAALPVLHVSLTAPQLGACAAERWSSKSALHNLESGET
jgi:type IV secretory pathway VirJ component